MSTDHRQLSDGDCNTIVADGSYAQLPITCSNINEWCELSLYCTVGLHEGGLSSVQYTFIASENITANMQLLQLLEARFGINHYCIC